MVRSHSARLAVAHKRIRRDHEGEFCVFGDWYQHVDHASGKPYFYNYATNVRRVCARA